MFCWEFDLACVCVYDQVWDDELEKSATYWAEQCQWEHGPQDLLMSIGQNLAVHWGRYEYTHIYKDHISLFLYNITMVTENMEILEYYSFKTVISGLKTEGKQNIFCCIFDFCLIFVSFNMYFYVFIQSALRCSHIFQI